MTRKKATGLRGSNFKNTTLDNDRWTQGKATKQKEEKEISNSPMKPSPEKIRNNTRLYNYL
jgi:hypothetical protein